MNNKLTSIIEEILSASEKEKFSIDKHLDTCNEDEKIKTIAYLFENIPSINMEVIILKSSYFFKNWSLNDWKFLVTKINHEINNSDWALSIFFLKYTYQEPDFISNIGINLEPIFVDINRTAKTLKNEGNQKAVNFVFKSLNLTPEEINNIRNFGIK